jgi:hypothetical protein
MAQAEIMQTLLRLIRVMPEQPEAEVLVQVMAAVVVVTSTKQVRPAPYELYGRVTIDNSQ